jgi:hypothetical protein
MRRVTGFSPMRLGLLVGLAVVLGVAAVASLATWVGDNNAEVASGATAGGRNVKVIIAGTNDALEPVIDGGIAGEGTFRATGAITDSGAARGYRGLTGVNNTVILLRYVTWGKKGTITYGVTIDTTRRPVISRWKIESATKAYKGLQGKGTETENATYTVSTLRGKVWR